MSTVATRSQLDYLDTRVLRLILNNAPGGFPAKVRKMFKRGVRALAVLFTATACASTAWGDDLRVSLKDHEFLPRELTIPANTKVKIIVRNLDSVPAEFESYDLNREKVVGPGSEIVVFIGPIDPGRYGFFDDFHRETTGTIVAK